MGLDGSDRVGRCLDALCAEGCKAVRGYIKALEQGRAVRGTESLRTSERARLLRELKAIMAVYGPG